jgi:hypothetical protein
LANVAEQALNGIGGPDIAVHRLRKVVEGQGLLFLLDQTPDSLWVEFAVLGECSRPVASRLPPCSAGPKCRPVRSRLAGAPVWERR